MAAPIVSAVLDKTAPNIGDVVTLTATYSDPDATTNAVTVTGIDAEGHPASVSVSFNVGDPVTLAVSDSAGRTWTKISDSGAVAVYRTTI